ncbi:MAG: AraC family transcriptional regulator [Bacteroidetes bacterium]|nr:AraC family transcriptional regulator [Bacteroidota bacterium]
MEDDYIGRLSDALTFIEENLDNDLSLETVAGIACYSPFHFHRLFKALTNETLNVYVTRKRIERSAINLANNRALTISQIAAKYGFKSDAVFSRTFRKIYGQSPTTFRKNHNNTLSKIGKTDSNNDQQPVIAEEYFCNINHLKQWISMNAKIEIVNTTSMYVASVSTIGVSKVEDAFLKMIRWATPKGLLNRPDTHVCRIFHDSFKITDAEKVRMSIGIISTAALPDDSEVQLSVISPLKCIVGHFIIDLSAFETAWNSLFIWMNTNGYKKAEQNPFEIYLNNPSDHPEKKYMVDFYIPVEM